MAAYNIPVPDADPVEEVMTIPNYLNMRPAVTVLKKGKAPGEVYQLESLAIDTNNHIFITECEANYVSHAYLRIFREGKIPN